MLAVLMAFTVPRLNCLFYMVDDWRTDDDIMVSSLTTSFKTQTTPQQSDRPKTSNITSSGQQLTHSSHGSTPVLFAIIRSFQIPPSACHGLSIVCQHYQHCNICEHSSYTSIWDKDSQRARARFGFKDQNLSYLPMESGWTYLEAENAELYFGFE